MSPRVGFYDDPVFREHDAGTGHPERPQRLEALVHGLERDGLLEHLEHRGGRPATREELRRVHTEAHVDRVEATAGRTVRFDADTQAGPRSCEAALRAAGTAAEAVDRVLDGTLDRAFCAVRPPGHHAESDRAMGFCFFNNVAVAAAQALARGLSRVLVIDFDVHHGNGTEEIFRSDPRVLYVSSHAYPFYPGTGALRDAGEGPGRGFTVNLPLPAGMGDEEYARVYREIVGPLGRVFDPELVLVSAGFDPYRGDPLAPMQVSERGFAELAQVCLETAEGAARGKVVFVFEGGYDLEGIAGSAAAVAGVLLGGSHAPIPFATQGPLDPLIDAFRRQVATFWDISARSR